MSSSESLVAAPVAERLQKIRKRNGLSHSQMASATSLTRPGVIAIEQGRRPNLRLSTLVEIAAALKVDIVDLLAERELEAQVPDSRTPLDRISAALKVLRKEHDLSQEALSARAGRSLKYVGRIEQGLSNPTFGELLRLAEVLGVAPHSLFLDQPEKGAAPAKTVDTPS